MLFKSNKELEDHILKLVNNSLVEKGVKITTGKITKGMVMLKLFDTPLSFVYGWDKESDYWVLSDN